MQNRALVKALNPLPSPLPSHGTAEENRRAQGTCQGFTAAGRHNSVHQPLAENQEQTGIVSNQPPEHGQGKRKLSPISSQQTQGTRGKDTISSHPALLNGF